MGYQGKFTEKFSEGVLQKLDMPRKAIAMELNLPYSTYDNYVRGEICFPPDLISKLFEITKDIRILEFFIKPCGYYLGLNNEAESSFITREIMRLSKILHKRVNEEEK